ncbi:MAG TPA: thiolase family protein [Kofleriaceae bacterium]|nr:thiolase family protein [Kofleriaceae bacterium]
MTRKRLNQRVAITGVGCSRFGDLLSTPEIAGLSLQELAAVAAREAFDDAGMSPLDVEAVFIGNVMAQSAHLPATYSHLSKWIGTQLRPGVHIDAACSTTNVGVTLAAEAIASGAVDSALVLGVEATRNQPKGLSPYLREPIPTDQMWLWTDMCCNQAYAVPEGYEIFSTYNGILGQAYCKKYGLSIETYDRAMFELCRTRRLHGSLAPKAFNQETLEDEARRHGFDDAAAFWRSRLNPFISWPARIRSVVTPADGASAILLTRADLAEDNSRAVELVGFGSAVSDLPWYDADPTDWKVDRLAIERAFSMAGVTGSDLQYLHTHDCSFIMSLCTAEQTGYLRPGEGARAALEGRLRFDGDRPMTTHGGRHAFGHAWAASAGSDTYEAVLQMRGEAGKRQLKRRPELAGVGTQGYAIISTMLVLKGI